MYRPHSPVSSVKIVQGVPSPIFTEARLGGGGLYTGHFALLWLKKRKKLHCHCQEKKYTYPARSSIHFPYFQQARRLFRFPSQVKFCLTKRVFCRSGGGYSCRKVFLKKILLANNLPMYMYTYVVPARGGAGGVLPYIGYIGMCRAKGYDFLAVLVWNRVSIILTIFVWNRVWFVDSSLESGMFYFWKKPLHHWATRPFPFQCLRQPCTRLRASSRIWASEASLAKRRPLSRAFSRGSLQLPK